MKKRFQFEIMYFCCIITDHSCSQVDYWRSHRTSLDAKPIPAQPSQVTLNYLNEPSDYDLEMLIKNQVLNLYMNIEYRVDITLDPRTNNYSYDSRSSP